MIQHKSAGRHSERRLLNPDVCLPWRESRYRQLRMRKTGAVPRCHLEAGAPALCRLTGQAGGRGTEAT